LASHSRQPHRIEEHKGATLLSLFSSDLVSNIQRLPRVTGATAWAALRTEFSEVQRHLLRSRIGTIETYEEKDKTARPQVYFPST
jgi:hypothetical protein